MKLVQMLCSSALHLVQRSHDVCHQDHERLGPPGVVEPRGVLTPSGLHQKVIRTGMSWHFMVFHFFCVFCVSQCCGISQYFIMFQNVFGVVCHTWPFACHQSSCSPDRHNLGFNGQNQAPSIFTSITASLQVRPCAFEALFPHWLDKKGVPGGGWCRVWWPEERMNAHVWHQLMIVLTKNWYARFMSNHDYDSSQ